MDLSAQAAADADGRLDEAEPLFRRALAARERTAGLEDAATLTAATNLARTLKQAKQFAEAGGLYKRVATALVKAHAGADGRVPSTTPSAVVTAVSTTTSDVELRLPAALSGGSVVGAGPPARASWPSPPPPARSPE